MKMSKKIFRLTFASIMVVFILSILIILKILYNYFENQIFDMLSLNAKYISYNISNNDSEFLDAFYNDDNRITIIKSDGTVLYDNKVDANNLEKHLDREEIKSAIEQGVGNSKRYSNTLTEVDLYYAVKLDNGDILRVSTTESSIIKILYKILVPIALISIIAIIISIYMSKLISDIIIKPINMLDLDNVESNETYEELTPLLKKLIEQKKIINKQIIDANKSREEFNLICENMQEGFLVIDANEKILSYNKAVINLLDIDDTDIKNDSVLTLNRTSGFRDVIMKTLSGIHAENYITHGDNKYNLIANPVFYDNKIIGAVVVIIDVTETEKREQLRREFTANVSHELKTPLTSISGFAEIMKNGDVDKETVIDFSKSIYDEAKRLINLVSDIIKISELDDGSIVHSENKIDLYELSKEIVNRLESIAKNNNIKLNVLGTNCCISGNKKVIDEMIYNLCDNAIKYNVENGTVDIIIGKCETNKIKLTVSDTGIGIPKSEQNRVFERFYRVDKSRSRLVGGTGLGLAIVKHAAICHNAKIELSSVENVGTSISVIFDECSNMK